MRFKLILEINKKAFGNILPINYQYAQSAVIYKILSKANEQYAEWLHENGFQLKSGKRFKLFTYSPFKIEKRDVLKESERIVIHSETVEWQISFLPEKSTEKFIQGLFVNQVFELGDRRSVVQFKVRNVEILASPEFSEDMYFETMSPICIRDLREDGSTEYLLPTDNRVFKAIQKSLSAKYESLYGKPFEKPFGITFNVLSELKRKAVTMKSGSFDPIRIIGYKCKFQLKAPVELMKIAYESGIGEQCSVGFGCVRELKSEGINDIKI